MDKETLETNIKEGLVYINRIRREAGRRIVGQAGMVDGLLTGLLAEGHILVEGVPGLAKTLAVKTLAETINAEFKRLQFTPDLLPADLVGTMIYRQQTGEFLPRKGPVFSNIILADEINRAPAKVQSALLECMEEKQVTLGDTTYHLPDPFFVLATQNPIEQEGTYPLPEAQLDRFLLKLKVEYPTQEEELQILRKMGDRKDIPVMRVIDPEKVAIIRNIISKIHADERIAEYIVSLVSASRLTGRGEAAYSRFIEYGASPRATIYLYRCAKVKAFFEGRAYVVPDDVKAMVYDVLRHRIILSYEAESEELTPEEVIAKILATVPVP